MNARSPFFVVFTRRFFTSFLHFVFTRFLMIEKHDVKNYTKITVMNNTMMHCFIQKSGKK